MTRVLFISSFYPPHEIGGWGQLVRDVNLRLQQRGCQTHVLTSNYGTATSESGVSRLLELESDLDHYRIRKAFFGRIPRQKRNLTHLFTVFDRFKPDKIFIHNLWNLTPAIATAIEKHFANQTIYYLASDWVYAPDVHQAFWHTKTNRHLVNFIKKLITLTLSETNLELKHGLCVSDAIRKNLIERAGVVAENLTVVHNGIDLNVWFPTQHKTINQNLSLLYAGAIAPHKGVHTAIEALALVNECHLTIVGDGHPQYKLRLEKLIAERDLHHRVTFIPRVTRRKMPMLMRDFDVLLLPSIWQEPLARIVQEAMATGLVVVGTATGGSAEIIFHNETGLVFEAENSAELAQHITILQNHPDERTRLTQNALAVVHKKFDIERTIDQIECHLTR